jgi:methylmalonyl-CoA/ethylmalonyl-CoA epimerase
MTAGRESVGGTNLSEAGVELSPAGVDPGAGAPARMSGAPGSFELTEIDHVAIAVRDLDAATRWYEETLGATVSHRERIEPDGVEEALLKVGDSYVQLLTPTRDDSPVARYLERHGEGIHHVGYRVTDCAAALESMRAAGATVIDASPRRGSRGTTVAFVHPKSAFGALVELVEE